MFKLENSVFKFHIQSQIVKIYDETIQSLRQDLREKEALQQSLMEARRKLRRDSDVLVKKLQHRVAMAVKKGVIRPTRQNSSYNRFKSKNGISKKFKFQLKFVKKTK